MNEAEDEPGNNVRGALLGLAAFGLFAAHDALVKVLGGSYGPFQIVFFSALFSFPLTTLYLMRDPARDTLIPRRPLWMAARTAAAVTTGVCAFYAFSVLPLTQTYAILFATPLIITVLSIPMLGEVVRVHRWAAVCIGLLGVVIALQPGTIELGLGHAAALVAAATAAIAQLIVRKIGSEERPVVLILYPLAANFVVVGALLPLDYAPVPLTDIAMFAGMSALAFVAMLFMIAAYKSGRPSVVAPMQYSQILWATLYGGLFFGEQLDLATGLGAVIVIGSGLYILFRERLGGNSVVTPVTRMRPRTESSIIGRLTAETVHTKRR